MITDNFSDWGTFKDNLKAPVHNWFSYPAGFSHRAVEHFIKENKFNIGKDTIYDPFMGVGTTNIVAKAMGINSMGVEAHPFVFLIAHSKLQWNIDREAIKFGLSLIENKIKSTKKPKNLEKFLKENFPGLILKCFSYEVLFDLYLIKYILTNSLFYSDLLNFFNLALICILREVSIASMGWPYVLPKKIRLTNLSKNVWEFYKKRVYKMYDDLIKINKTAYRGKTTHKIYFNDSRNTSSFITNESIDAIFTSPPYLNNFDYADATRIELYFTGFASNWEEITSKIRDRLIISTTSQVTRCDKYVLSEEFKQKCGNETKHLQDIIKELSRVRMTKGGKKNYDIVVSGYFNDIYKVLADNYRVLKPNSKAVYIIGDSAPYGVHINTDELIGNIGVSVGFKNYKVEVLRTRGGKWPDNPRRHHIPIRESIVTLEK